MKKIYLSCSPSQKVGIRLVFLNNEEYLNHVKEEGLELQVGATYSDFKSFGHIIGSVFINQDKATLQNLRHEIGGHQTFNYFRHNNIFAISLDRREKNVFKLEENFICICDFMCERLLPKIYHRTKMKRIATSFLIPNNTKEDYLNSKEFYKFTF